MKKNKNHLKDTLFACVGLGLFILGFVIYRYIAGADKTTEMIAYLCIAFGCGVFGHFIGNMIKHFSTKDDEALKRQMTIEKKDERNVLLAEKSKAKAYDLMAYLFAAMIIVFGLMGVDPLVLVTIVAIYLSIQIYGLYWRHKFGQMM